jgi:hypothetical protein
MGHAGLAVALVPGTNQDGHVDRDVGRRRVREEKHPDAVRELVFCDTLYGSQLLGLCLLLLGPDTSRLEKEKTNEQER